MIVLAGQSGDYIGFGPMNSQCKAVECAATMHGQSSHIDLLKGRKSCCELLSKLIRFRGSFKFNHWMRINA